MTFYGESVALDWANNLTGTGAGSSGDELRYHFDGTSTTVVPGDEFIAGAYMFGGGVSGLTDTDEVACAWAVEVGPATDGSLSFAAGLDPGFALTDPGLATTGLGTHALSGQSTLVLPVTLQTAAQILAHTEEQILRVQGVSGTVELLQVKLRVWPASGPSGAWTSGSGYSEPRTGMRLVDASGSEGAGPDGAHFGTGQAAADDAQQRARDLMYPDEGVPFRYDGTWDTTSAEMNLAVIGPYTDGTFTASAQFIERNAYVLADVDGLNPAPPSGSGYDPREVPDEAQSYVRGVGGGDAPASFAGWVGSFTVTCDNTNTSEPGFYGITDLPARPSITPDGTGYRIPWHSYAADAASSISGGPVTVPLTGGPYLALTPTTVGRIGPYAIGAAGLSVQQAVTISAIDPTFTVAFGDFEWWDPSLPWVDRQPRFFVKDYEGAWRPVGFGKPASDTSRFHVWTPVGWYVECLDGETYTNAHPLKVKLYDGTWDTVAHMRPL